MILTKANIGSFGDWIEESRNGAGGVALIDKDKEWTSFDVIGKMRGILKIKKIGHAGTLDPLATGLLIVACGKATKQIDSFQAQSKRYDTLIKIGATTRTYDSEAEEENPVDISGVTGEMALDAVKSFIGTIMQIPPMYSARKVNGTRLYELARKNLTVEVAPRQVEIYDITVKEINLPFLSLDIHCSKGTYIRSLARDIGEKLGTGGYLAALRRSGIGEFNVDNALRVSELAAAAEKYYLDKQI